MVDCPKCGTKMKVGGHIGPEPLYNCDKCGVDLYKPPKKITPSPKTDDTEKTPIKKPKRKPASYY